MINNLKKHNKEKTLFKSYYCATCQQRKRCRIWSQEKECCVCLVEKLRVEDEQEQQRWKEIAAQCQCQVGTNKVRVTSDYLTKCERCEKSISATQKMRVIKNRHDPRFWGLEIKERILCLACLGQHYHDIPETKSKKHTFRKYLKRYATAEAKQALRLKKVSEKVKEELRQIEEKLRQKYGE